MVLISSAPPGGLESLPSKTRHAWRSADGTASPEGSRATERRSDFALQAEDSDFPDVDHQNFPIEPEFGKSLREGLRLMVFEIECLDDIQLIFFQLQRQSGF